MITFSASPRVAMVFQLWMLVLGLAASGYFAWMGWRQAGFGAELERAVPTFQPKELEASCAGHPACRHYAEESATLQQMLHDLARANAQDIRRGAQDEYVFALLFAVLAIGGFIGGRAGAAARS